MQRIVKRTILAEGSFRVIYLTECPYYYDALRWYRHSVNPKADEAEFFGYVASIGMEYGASNWRHFDGIGNVRCITRGDAAQWTTAHKFAQAAHGFIVELPTFKLFTEETTQQPNTLDL